MIVPLRVSLLLFLLAVSAFSTITLSWSDLTPADLQVEKAVSFLTDYQFNGSLGLCSGTPNKPSTYWLVSDNLWVWKALEVANETYYFGGGDVGLVADIIMASLKKYATLYNLPRETNGFPVSFMHEAVIGDVIPTPNRNASILTLYSDGYNLKTEVCNGTILPDWKNYTDRLLYMALSCFWQGNVTEANLYFRNATAAWDGTGINDTATKADRFYTTYKLALLLYTSKVLGERLPFESELVNRIWSLQDESNGGIITNYYANGTARGDPNTETTSISIIAALTSPGAGLGTFAFYYAWYGTPADLNSTEGWHHWNEGNASGQIPHYPNVILPDGRRDIAAEDYPLLGPYDSNNESVIKQQIEWAKEAGIDCFIVSWWGNGTFEDKALSHIRKVCEENDFKFTVYLENTSTIDQTVGNLTYLLSNYANSSAWYKINGRPVVFVYARVRNSLNPSAWKLYGYYINPSNPVQDYWMLSEDIRKPPRYGIFPIHPYPNGIGYIENANPIYLPPNEKYSLKVGISDIRNDSGPASNVVFNVTLRNQNGTLMKELYYGIVHFADGWLDLSFNVTEFAGQDVFMRVESQDRGTPTWSSAWAAVDYLYINSSAHGIVSPDPFFDNGWNASIFQIRENGFNPYIIMDLQGYEGKINDFLTYFKDSIDGIHMYNPTSYSQNVSEVLDVYNIASESAHARNMTFLATVVPGFNNTAVQVNGTVIDRRDGTYYSLYWSIAKACSPDGYAITSFNEWHEGTEIEPSIEYGNQYIYLTRRETLTSTTPEFSSMTVSPLFIVSTLLIVVFCRRKNNKQSRKIPDRTQ